MHYPTVQAALAQGTGRHLASIPVTRLASGYEHDVFVHVIVGKRDGPKVAIVAGTHGGEIFVTELIRVFLGGIKPEDLAGTLLVVPTANLSAFEWGTRHTPVDMMNLNRIFPGTATGWFSDMIAHAMVEGLLPHCDWVIDYHCSRQAERTVRYTYTTDQSTPYACRVHDMAMATGAPLLYIGPRIAGSLGDYCEQLGIPTLIPEIGGSPVLEQAHMEAGLLELKNALMHIGMLQGKPVRPKTQTILRKHSSVRPRNGGLLCPQISLDMLGKTFNAPRVLAKVVHPGTLEELEEIKAPFAINVLLGAIGLAKVHPGDYAFAVADGSTAQVVTNNGS